MPSSFERYYIDDVTRRVKALGKNSRGGTDKGEPYH
jgi:hypothetical protein